MLKHKLIELTTCFDRQISEMRLFNKVLNQVGHQFADESSETFHQEPHVFYIRDEVDTIIAPTDPYIDEQAARAKSLAGYELRQHEIRAQQMLDGVKQEAVPALLQKEQKYTQQRAQDHAQAAATIRQREHRAQGFVSEAQGVIYELQGARQKERQEREMMKAEEEQAKQEEEKLNKERTKLDEESKKERTELNEKYKKKKTDDEMSNGKNL